MSAVFRAAEQGAELNAFVANPADAEALALIRRQTDSNKTLLAPDPTSRSRMLIQVVPLLTSPAIEVSTVCGIPNGYRAQIAVRKDVQVKVDASALFVRDLIAIKATTRIATVFPDPEAIIKIVADAAAGDGTSTA